MHNVENPFKYDNSWCSPTRDAWVLSLVCFVDWMQSFCTRSSSGVWGPAASFDPQQLLWHRFLLFLSKSVSASGDHLRNIKESWGALLELCVCTYLKSRIQPSIVCYCVLNWPANFIFSGSPCKMGDMMGRGKATFFCSVKFSASKISG